MVRERLSDVPSPEHVGVSWRGQKQRYICSAVFQLSITMHKTDEDGIGEGEMGSKDTRPSWGPPSEVSKHRCRREVNNFIFLGLLTWSNWIELAPLWLNWIQFVPI